MCISCFVEAKLDARQSNFVHKDALWEYTLTHHMFHGQCERLMFDKTQQESIAYHIDRPRPIATLWKAELHVSPKLVFSTMSSPPPFSCLFDPSPMLFPPKWPAVDRSRQFKSEHGVRKLSPSPALLLLSDLSSLCQGWEKYIYTPRKWRSRWEMATPKWAVPLQTVWNSPLHTLEVYNLRNLRAFHLLANEQIRRLLFSWVLTFPTLVLMKVLGSGIPKSHIYSEPERQRFKKCASRSCVTPSWVEWMFWPCFPSSLAKNSILFEDHRFVEGRKFS